MNESICLAFDWFDAQHELVRRCWKAVAKTNQGRWGGSEWGRGWQEWGKGRKWQTNGMDSSD